MSLGTQCIHLLTFTGVGPEVQDGAGRSLHEHAGTLKDDGEGTTVRGPVTVSEPGLPDRTPPANVDMNDGDPALWAWRIREKQSGNKGGPTWQTTESGLAVGSFSLQQDWQNVTVDPAELGDETTGILQSQTDPFEAPNCYFGEPEIDEYLGELNPINKKLEESELAGEDGLVSEVEVGLSSGGETMMPDRYQATVVCEGEELIVRGNLDQSGDDPVLRGTEETPMVVGFGDTQHQADQLRAKAKKELAIGIGIVTIALILAVITVLWS